MVVETLTPEEHMGCNMGPQMEVLQEINARRDCQDAARAAGNNAEVRQLEEEIVALQVTLDGVMSDDPAVCAEALQCLPSSPGAAARRETQRQAISNFSSTLTHRAVARAVGDIAEFHRLEEEIEARWARLAEIMGSATVDAMRTGRF